MSRRVVVTGLGILSPVGTGKEKFWGNLVNGRSGVGKISAFDTSAYRVKIGGMVKDFEPERYLNPKQIHTAGRAAQYAYSGAKMALADSGISWEALATKRTAVCLGTTMGEIQVVEGINETVFNNGIESVAPEEYLKARPDRITTFLSSELGIGGPQHLFFNACAAGNYALGYAADLIHRGQADLALAGGVDVFSKVALIGFNRLLSLTPDWCRPFDRNRKGLVVSEGAGVLVLEDLEMAVARGAAIYAEIRGYGLGMDAYHITSPHPEGEGAAVSMSQALKAAGMAAEEIDYICAHGTGTPANDKTECRAIHTVFKNVDHLPPVSSIKSMLGHTMGAAGALGVAACCLMLQQQIILPTMNFETPDPECNVDCVPNEARQQRLKKVMSNAFAFGGNNSCLVLEKI
ncbi:MAG TPA: beta-ketoacyl-[acyl-carrier-protein] synthase family protein [Bacillota bacterium]|nr:beta-ketoacyl-[acyl-carrier-protein] synthase family protein [Bacillota bacterium]